MRACRLTTALRFDNGQIACLGDHSMRQIILLIFLPSKLIWVKCVLTSAESVIVLYFLKWVDCFFICLFFELQKRSLAFLFMCVCAWMYVGVAERRERASALQVWAAHPHQRRASQAVWRLFSPLFRGWVPCLRLRTRLDVERHGKRRAKKRKEEKEN